MTSLARFIGGPHAGDKMTDLPWPLPDFIDLPLEHGSYKKTNESQITDEQAATMSHVIRGAEYEWFPDLSPTI